MEIAEQLTLLAELANVEKKWKNARSIADTLPAEAKKAQDAADVKRNAQTEIERKQHEIEMARRAMDSELQAEKDKLRKWENRADQIRGEREHAALMSEIGGQKRAISRTENDILEKMQELEDLAKQHEAKKEAADAAQAAADEEWTKVDADVKVAEAEAKQLDDQRRTLVEKLPPALVRRYEGIAKRRGHGIAIIEGEVCTSCRTSLPPQLVIQVYKGAILETCQTCQRILVHEAMTRAPDAEDEGTDGSASEAAPA